MRILLDFSVAETDISLFPGTHKIPAVCYLIDPSGATNMSILHTAECTLRFVKCKTHFLVFVNIFCLFFLEKISDRLLDGKHLPEQSFIDHFDSSQKQLKSD